jgi:formylglycine-generating enzyme required for sulfatase activity
VKNKINLKTCVNSECRHRIPAADNICNYCGHSQRWSLIPFIIFGIGVLSVLVFQFQSKKNQPNPITVQLTNTARVQIQLLPTKSMIGPAVIPTLKEASDPSSGAQNTSLKVSTKDGMKIIFIPAGEFIMGSNTDYPDERPAHKVYLDSFWIGQTEVTNGMYSRCVNSGACSPQNKTYHNPSTGSYHYGSSYENYPAVYVNWIQANSYCNWANGRLPTEAEWEKAARGTNGLIYPWGNESPSHNLANYGNYMSETDQVGNYPGGASPYGVLDMAGNVWEWVSDYYDENYYSSSLSQNPTGPASGVTHVIKGGSFFAKEDYLRVAVRERPDSTATESYGSGNWGFRCTYYNY